MRGHPYRRETTEVFQNLAADLGEGGQAHRRGVLWYSPWTMCGTPWPKIPQPEGGGGGRRGRGKGRR